MTGTSTAGADWKGTGELKVLRRIVGGSAEEDEDVPAPPVGHNRPPCVSIHKATADEVELEAQAEIVANAIAAADVAERHSQTLRSKTGNELLKLQAIFCRAELHLDREIERLKSQGHTTQAIAAALDISKDLVNKRYRAAKAGAPMGIGNAALGRFLTWAGDRFGKNRKTISEYMSIARGAARRSYQKERINAAGKLGRAILQAQAQPGVQAPLQRVFIALPPQSRRRWLLWAASLEIGSEDPQEVARWFAAHRLV